ncbi:MFS transporter [Streptomyces sp. NPDC047085]|uniref:MFS transporter n=1 Tax=Streptomyces sp. NPDC047085 TaxID=3155140 RepID=UPI0033C438A5
MASADGETVTEHEWQAQRRHRNLFRAVYRRTHPRLRRSDITVTDERLVRRAVKAAALGNAMEWFDFGIYSYLAVTIGNVFFPAGTPTARLLASFAAFAIAFLVRPLGGMFFGPLGDRIGRRTVLATTMITMALGTFCIGLIPSHATIGNWAPALLVFFRLIQGFSTGGEYGGAATFMAEYAPDRRRGFFCSFLELGTLAGYVAAATLVTVMTALLGEGTMNDWGWRVPFLAAGPLGLIGVYLRMRLDETPAYLKLEAQHTAPISFEHGNPDARPGKEFRRIFAEQWPALLLCFGLVAAYNINDYMLLSYMPTYLTTKLGYEETHGLVVLLVTMVVLMAVITFVGRLNDRVGRRPLLMAGMAGYFFLSLPAFLLLRQGSLAAVIVGMAMLGFSLVCLLGTMSAALPALFPTEARYGGLAIGYNLATSLFGGTTPLVVTGLISATGTDLMPAYYAMAAALVGMVCVYLMKETAQRPLDGSPPAVATEEEAQELINARFPASPY